MELHVMSKNNGKKEIDTIPEEELVKSNRERPPINQAQNPMHEAEIQKERERIYNELKKRDQK